MITSFASRALVAASLSGLALVSLLAPIQAAAREGAPVGHGIKCYWALVSSANGVNTYQQVCRKGA